MRGFSHTVRSRRRLRREVRWTVTAVVVLLVVEFLVLPRLGGFRKSLDQVSHINGVYVIAGLLLEAAALAAYAQLTYTVLSPGGPGRWRLLRIDLSSLALSHVVPGGTAPGVGLSYRLLSQSGVGAADAGFALAMQGVGSAVVLNVLVWLALLMSLFTNGYNSLYSWAALAGTVLMASFAAVIVALTKGRHRSVEVVRVWADHVPFLNGDRLAEGVQRVAERLKDLAGHRDLLYRAVLWAAANWLLDAGCLWVFIAAFHHYVSPINVLVAYGLANILAVIPITPGGLGIIEGVLVSTLVGFGVPLDKAGVAVLGYRLVNFWLPIPVGGGAYLSLRFETLGWRQRLRNAREEIVEQKDQPSSKDRGSANATASSNGTTPPNVGPLPTSAPATSDANGAPDVSVPPDTTDTGITARPDGSPKPEAAPKAEARPRPGWGGAESR
jgi:hypothetical protein